MRSNIRVNARISVIIPTYCEAHNLPHLISKIVDSVTESQLRGNEIEIIVVDDNSPDGTGKLGQSLAGEHPEMKVIIRTDERGLGTAVLKGITASTGDVLVVMDADLTHDPALIPQLVDQLASNGADIALGSRFVNGFEMESSLHHIWGSKALNTFIRVLLQIPAKDVTGGFFALRRDALGDLDVNSIFRGYGDYFFALLYRGSKRGWKMKEVACEYRARREGLSKTSFFKAGFSYGVRALKLRVNLE